MRRAVLPDGTSMFCVWLSVPGQQGALMQSSLRDNSGSSLGAVGTITTNYTDESPSLILSPYHYCFSVSTWVEGN